MQRALGGEETFYLATHAKTVFVHGKVLSLEESQKLIWVLSQAEACLFFFRSVQSFVSLSLDMKSGALVAPGARWNRGIGAVVDLSTVRVLSRMGGGRDSGVVG